MSALPSAQEIVARAAALAPALRERSAQAEARRRVPDETIADLLAAGLTRIVQPSRYGGYDMGWDVLCESSMALAQGCGSQAWVGNIFAEHNFLIGLFPDEAQRDVWENNPDVLASSSFIPRGNRVESVEGSYALSGRWPFQSGVHHSSWSVVGELAPGEGGAQEHRYFLVPAEDRTIVDDWHTVGMAGTGSCSVELDRAFVPAHRTLPNRLVAAGATPGASLNTAPVFRMPMIGYSLLALASVVVGVAGAMAEDFAEYLEDRAQQGRMRPGSEALPTRLAEAAAEIRAAKLLVLAAARTNMEKLARGERLDDTDAAVSRRDGAYAVVLARRAAGRIFEGTGGHGVYLGSHLLRSYRDILAAGAHAGLSWDTAAAEYGKSRFGQKAAKLF